MPLSHTYPPPPAAGDGLGNSLFPHQLRELVVMSGLDPAAVITRQLVELLLERRGTAAQQQRISFDDFMKVWGVLWEGGGAARRRSSSASALMIS